MFKNPQKKSLFLNKSFIFKNLQKTAFIKEILSKRQENFLLQNFQKKLFYLKKTAKSFCYKKNTF